MINVIMEKNNFKFTFKHVGIAVIRQYCSKRILNPEEAFTGYPDQMGKCCFWAFLKVSEPLQSLQKVL